MSFRRWGSMASAILFFAGIIFIPLPGEINWSCTCFDACNMINRYKQVNCLLEEICKERNDLRNSGKGAKSFDFGDYKKNYQPLWEKAMGKCKNKFATEFPKGDTDAFCHADYEYVSHCMHSSVKSHEEHHIETCKNTFKNKPDCTHSSRPSILQNGYADCLTWDEYFTDDIEAYNIELTYLKGQIDFWRPICTTLDDSNNTRDHWCYTADSGLEASKCPSSVTLRDLLLKIANYFVLW